MPFRLLAHMNRAQAALFNIATQQLPSDVNMNLNLLWSKIRFKISRVAALHAGAALKVLPDNAPSLQHGLRHRPGGAEDQILTGLSCKWALGLGGSNARRHFKRADVVRLVTRIHAVNR